MTITKEYDVSDVRNNSWSGAVSTLNLLTDDEVETILNILEDCYPNGMGETELNDFFWFDTDTIAEWLGYSDFEELIEARR